MKIKSRTTVFEGFFKVEKITLEYKNETLERDLITPKNAVAALVFDTKKQKYILIEQYRLAAQKQLVEIVAGLLDKPGEIPEDAITREIEEEIGYKVDKLELISNFYSTPGSYTEKIWLFYAEVSRKTGEGGGSEAENEDIKTVSFSPENLYQTTFEDAKTIMAALWAKCHNLN